MSYKGPRRILGNDGPQLFANARTPGYALSTLIKMDSGTVCRPPKTMKSIYIPRLSSNGYFSRRRAGYASVTGVALLTVTIAVADVGFALAI